MRIVAIVILGAITVAGCSASRPDEATQPAARPADPGATPGHDGPTPSSTPAIASAETTVNALGAAVTRLRDVGVDEPPGPELESLIAELDQHVAELATWVGQTDVIELEDLQTVDRLLTTLNTAAVDLDGALSAQEQNRSFSAQYLRCQQALHDDLAQFNAISQAMADKHAQAARDMTTLR